MTFIQNISSQEIASCAARIRQSSRWHSHPELCARAGSRHANPGRSCLGHRLRRTRKFDRRPAAWSKLGYQSRTGGSRHSQAVNGGSFAAIASSNTVAWQVGSPYPYEIILLWIALATIGLFIGGSGPICIAVRFSFDLVKDQMVALISRCPRQTLHADQCVHSAAGP